MWTNLKSQSRPEMVGIFINRLFLSSRCYQKGLYKYWISRWIGSLFWETRTTREELWSNVVYRIIKMIHPDWIFNIDPLKKKKNNYHRSCENEIETSKNKQFHVMLYYRNYTLVNTRKFKGRKIGGKLKG